MNKKYKIQLSRLYYTDNVYNKYVEYEILPRIKQTSFLTFPQRCLYNGGHNTGNLIVQPLTSEYHMSTDKNIKYAGVSIINDDEYRFHTTKLERRVSGWFDIPGHALYVFERMPRPMDKMEATKYLLKHKNFQNSKMQKFLKSQLERRELGVPVNPRAYVVSPAQIRAASQRVRNSRNNHRMAA